MTRSDLIDALFYSAATLAVFALLAMLVLSTPS